MKYNIILLNIYCRYRNISRTVVAALYVRCMSPIHKQINISSILSIHSRWRYEELKKNCLGGSLGDFFIRVARRGIWINTSHCANSETPQYFIGTQDSEYHNTTPGKLHIEMYFSNTLTDKSSKYILDS